MKNSIFKNYVNSNGGVAAKLVGSGYTIGRALSAYSQAGQGTILMFANLFYKANIESFVPIWDGKIEGVVKEISDLKKRVERLEKSQNRR